jgi:hypothetical protein
MYESQSTLVVQRTDSITAHGEGRQQQHQLIVDAVGTGSANYYLVPEQGLVLHLTTAQELALLIKVSGRTSQFRESAKEDYSLIR